MKKFVFIIIFVLIISCFASCGGNVDGMKTRDVQSEIYTNEEIQDAIDVVTKEFDRDWSGCTLTELYYAGDEASENSQEFADRNNADEVIVLMSSFDVDSSGGPNGVMNPDSTYAEWMWILVRTDGGKWKHVDGGY